MEKNSIQLLFNEKEYETLKKQADSQGVTVPLYIKSVVLQDNDFSISYRKLIDKADNLPSGTRFNIKALFGVDWTMSRGVKLNLGKTYYSRVSQGIITNVKAIGRDSSNIMWYEKL